MTDTEIELARGDEGMDVDMQDDPAVHRKGRGFGVRGERDGTDGVRSGGFERLEGGKDSGVEDRAARSVEGWIVLVTNVHEEATEEEVADKFADFGEVKNLHLNLDRRTGYVKGYVLVEYETHDEARRAIDACTSGELTLLEKELSADFAFVRPPTAATPSAGGGRGQGRRSAGGAGGRNRSRSPARR